jgi:hypothetical protein
MRSVHNRLLLYLLSFEKKRDRKRGRVEISCVDANLTQVAPERRDIGGQACPSQCALGHNAYFSKR